MNDIHLYVELLFLFVTLIWIMDELLQKHREKLVDSDLYHYLPNIALSDFVWTRPRGTNTKVLVKSDGDNNMRDGDEDEAIFSIIATVSKEDTYIKADGNYAGPTEYVKDLADVKLAFALTPVTNHQQLSQDFANAVSLIKKLRADTGLLGRKEGIVIKSGNVDKIRLQYCVFRKRTAEDDINAGKDNDANPVSEYNYRGYPVDSSQARLELKDMGKSRSNESIFNVIPFMTEHGQCVPPSQYRELLIGSTVNAIFSVSHNAIAKGNVDRFTADLVGMSIVAPVAVDSPERYTNIQLSFPRLSSAAKRKATEAFARQFSFIESQNASTLSSSELETERENEDTDTAESSNTANSSQTPLEESTRKKEKKKSRLN
ncbi:hypothetical protein D9757_004878 [Collybiopsis confluens]|uniref:Uncharacterized protein n=1 Tax=Collybiopsis confluens TaxID=2823264 RepID=A0A8H5HSY2_9AGAR|nr:hypothetical protein D9757_004878 [Collybiopsis confluens]